MAEDDIPISSNIWTHFKRELSRRVIAISYAKKDTPNPKDWIYASGIFINVAGRFGVLTVKHFLEPLYKEFDKSNLLIVQLRFSHFSGALQTVDVLPDAIGKSYVIEVANHCDAGVIWIPEEVATQRMRDDAKAFADGELAVDLSEVEVFFPILGGYPNQANIVDSKSVLIAKESGQWADYKRFRLGSVGFQCTWAGKDSDSFVIFKDDLPLTNDTLRLVPYQNRLTSSTENPVKSAVGMSGCPIFAICHDEEAGCTMFDPRLLGMQSKQFSIPREDYLHISGIEIVTLRALQRFFGL